MTGNHWDEAVVIALGSNLKGRFESSCAVLINALDRFGEIGLIVKAKSSIWRSQAWPDPHAPPYFNAVAMVSTTIEPEPLLRGLHHLEAQFGRRRTTPNAPRVLDLDLIAYGRLARQDSFLTLPHPRAADRRFVMGPLAEIAPAWSHPRSAKSAKVLALDATIGRDAAPLAD